MRTLPPSLHMPAPAALAEVNRLPKSASYFYRMGSLERRKIKKIKRAVKSKKRDFQFESKGL